MRKIDSIQTITLRGQLALLTEETFTIRPHWGIRQMLDLSTRIDEIEHRQRLLEARLREPRVGFFKRIFR